jgi:LysR family transcriptional regulator, benzoate and cis,cis-muconate-responsive activator of ben and cat genes
MELRHLRYFLAVAEELHFSRAAARLHIAQPPLSHQIRQLEGELGFDLFLRTNRRVRLTDAGRYFRDEARSLLERLERAKAAAQRVAGGESGSLEVGHVAAVTFALLPRLYRLFRARHPDVALTLSEMSTAEQVEALRAGQIHLGLARQPVGDETLTVEPLLDEPLVVALPLRHPLAKQRTIALRDLSRERFVLYPRSPRHGWIEVVKNACRAAGFQPIVAQEALELSTAVTLVAAGIGITLVPHSARALRLDGVVYRDLCAPAPVTRLVAVCQAGESRPVVQRFLEVVREVVRG